jgi:osmotically-inducible protein OsmY
MAIVLVTTAIPVPAVAADNVVSRNQDLETAVARHLRQQGFGQESRILVLAAGSRVFLLGVVPDANDRERAAQVAAEVRGVRRVDSMLVADRVAEPKDDAQLRRDVQEQLEGLRPGAIADPRVETDNGVAALRGHAETWQDMAKAIQAAFNAGARYVVSELTVGTQPRYDPDRRYLSRPPTRLRRGPIEDFDRGARYDEGRRYDYDAEPDYEFGGADDEYGPDYGDFEDLGQVSPWEYDFNYEPGESRWLEPREYERWRRRELPESRAYGPTYGRGFYRDDYTSRYQPRQYVPYGREAAERDRLERRWMQSARDRQAQQALASDLLDNIEDAGDV